MSALRVTIRVIGSIFINVWKKKINYGLQVVLFPDNMNVGTVRGCSAGKWVHILKVIWFLGSGPEGVDDLCFHTGEFSPPPPSSSPPSTSRPISQPRGSYPSLEAQIPVLRPKSHLRGPNPSLEGFGPQDWDLGLKAGIWASRLRYGPEGWGRGDGGGGGEGENSPV